MVTNNFINRIRKWPIERKRTFSVMLALFFTVLIIIINFFVSSFWWDESNDNGALNRNNPISILQQSFSKIWSEAEPSLNQIFASSTEGLFIESSEKSEYSTATSSDY